MGSSTISILVAALAKLSSMLMNWSSRASRTMSAEGIMTGGGVAMWTGDDGMTLVTCGELMVVVLVEEWGEGNCLLLSSLALLLCVFGRSFFSGVSAIEVGDKFWGMFQMLHGFPGTVTCGKTFPLN